MHLKRISEVFSVEERKLNLMLYNNFHPRGLYTNSRLDDVIFNILKDRILYYREIGNISEDRIKKNIITDAPISRVCGCYFLFNNNNIVYVGQSVNILSRILSHTDKIFDQFSYIELDAGILGVVEMSCIVNLKPKYNSYKHKTTNINEYYTRKAIEYAKNM